MPSALVLAVVEAAREAGRAIIEARCAGPLEVRQKAEGPVTNADIAANAVLEARLRALLPDAAWLSEETVDDGDRLQRTRVWVVDPLDGTREFIAGTAAFGVSVALVEQGRPVIGVIHFPVDDETYFASTGSGAFLQIGEEPPRPLAVRASHLPRALAVRRADLRAPVTEALVAALGNAALKPAGSTVRKLVMVACGEADAYVSLGFVPCEWDICAGAVIIEEAGGRLMNASGEVPTYNRPDPHVTGGLLACRAAVCDIVLSAVAPYAK